jgi:hypothetical protein
MHLSACNCRQKLEILNFYLTMEQPEVSACSSKVYDLINQPHFSTLGQIVAPFSAVESAHDLC